MNDLHIGVKRSAGTTPATQVALRQSILTRLRELLDAAFCADEAKDVLILGDLFDEFTVELADLWETLDIFASWLSTSGSRLILVRGNHDWSPKADRLSSFDLLASCLQRMYYEQVSIIREGMTLISKQVFIIPHMPNQDLFDMELDKAIELASSVQAGVPLYLLTHCNVLPPACHGQRDHSLNIDMDRAVQLTKHFTILNAHEHQHQFHNIGRGIYCLGNQIPTSVADCMAKGAAQSDGIKYAHEINDQGVVKHPVWDAINEFSRIDWRELDQPIVDTVKFVRIEGSALAEESSRAVDAIARFRNQSDAFVVSNAVRVEGQEGVEDAAAATFEGLKSFDVLEALLGELNPEERMVIELVMNDGPAPSPAVAKFLEGVEA
ncbi:metallophosphoesterase [Ferribacterium limneticum]|uniref:metallophosphoesterase n=1 Tax=Ferribacterium limneticum TaxID=76259 RepID=UPI0021F63575|nr:metallophosphoesterase [Ferribacterium limneticum]UCV26703.1 metallophosphoesterase [Ferribacterium limneticum]UCV30620.1 metallophosphoesterase [Ferribacterium limneticum]